MNQKWKTDYYICKNKNWKRLDKLKIKIFNWKQDDGVLNLFVPRKKWQIISIHIFFNKWKKCIFISLRYKNINHYGRSIKKEAKKGNYVSQTINCVSQKSRRWQNRKKNRFLCYFQFVIILLLFIYFFRIQTVLPLLMNWKQKSCRRNNPSKIWYEIKKAKLHKTIQQKKFENIFFICF